MKRGAERQIQREDGEDPHDVEGDSEGTSSIETEPRNIASRPIRGLPKKKLGGSPSLPAQTLSSSPFSFSSFNSTQQSGSASAPTFTTTGSPSFSASTTTPVSVSSSSSSSLSASNNAPFTFSAPKLNSNGSADSAGGDVEYYLKLRGLNLSLKSQLIEVISKQIEKDPFADLTEVLKNVERRYSTLRGEVDTTRREEPNTVLTPSASKAPTAPLTSVTPETETAKTAFSPAAPSFTPQKVPAAGGGFTFAGSSFSAPASSTNTSASNNLLPGQPTFSIPSTGFYSSFGKEEENGDKEGENEDAKEQNLAKSQSIESTRATKATSGAASAASSSSSLAAPLPSFAPSTNTFGSSSTANPKPFSFGTPSNAPFSFGSAASRPPVSTTNEASPDKAFRFSFGTSNANQSKLGDEGEKSIDSAFSSTSSSISSSPSKAPSIGSNFANTSGVKQGGAFTFGSSKINFGSPSPSSTFGNNSTGFTFGSSPAKDSNASDGSK